MAKNDNRVKAKQAKDDEFYTKLEDIESEISSHLDYVNQFQGKVVLCNCDDPEWSNFYEFFRLHFKQLGLKKLITTHYNKDGSPSYKLEWSGEMMGEDTINMIKTPLEGDGDFRSEECVALLDEADIVVTNPPFSLFKEYIPLLIAHNKDFIVLGNMSNAAYAEIYPFFESNKVHFGYNAPKEFRRPDGSIKKFGNIVWFTTLDLDKVHDAIPLNKNYTGNETQYPFYDNYDAIEVGAVKDIPKDYMGIMGVPVSFLTVYCPEQFEIVACTQTGCHPASMVKTTYKDFIGYHQNGQKTGRTGSTCGHNPMLEKNDGIHDYYMNANGKIVQSANSRLFIRRKSIEVTE